MFMILLYGYGGIMKKRSFLIILLGSLLITGCTPTPTSSEPVDSNSTTETNPGQFLLDQGYVARSEWPKASLTTLLVREEVPSEWVAANVPVDQTATANDEFYTKSYDMDEGVITYKTIEIVRLGDVAIFNAYLASLNTSEWTIVSENEHAYSAKAFSEDKLTLISNYTEPEDEIPGFTTFTFTVKEKEEFPGALKPNKDASQVQITFANDIKIKTRSIDLVSWNFLGLTFNVEKDNSEIAVGNIPNNNGIGYLASPNLRVYTGQKLTFDMGEKRLEQVIIHTANYTEDGVSVVSLDALPKYDDAAIKSFEKDTSILYHFHNEVKTFSFNVSANARLLDIVAIYS